MNRLAAFAAVLFCTPVLADPPVVRISQDQQRKVCNQGVCSIQTSTIWGTGTIIGRDTKSHVLVLTCGHGWQAGAVDIWFKKGDHRPGQLLANRTDRDIDLGLISFNHKGDIATCTLSESSPSKGHALTAGGWGDGSSLQLNCVDCEGYYGKATLAVNRRFRSGDSGGPVLWDNKLVGIVTGNMDQHGMATGSKACRAFVQATIGMVPGPIEETDAPPIPGPPPEKLEPRSNNSPEFSVIMRRLDTIERRLDLLTPFPKATP